MSRYLLQLLLLAVFILPTTNLSATHIVGGEIGYNCLGGDQYEIVLSVYRDCFNGDQQAPFDDPAYVGIYNQFNVLVQSIPIALMDDDTLTTIITDPCLVIEAGVCVHTTTYRKVVTLPFLPGGYTLSYQRCCRNITLENIINPVETGATFEIHLNEESMLQCNNSPKFNFWPAIYICVDRELVFDHSAEDIEGDSLVYSLCTPNAGGSLSDPQPIPPETPPPYDDVIWAPGFGVDNMLGAGVPLAIDPVTGVLTATPGLTGQYVVGICVEEYDAATGELLSVTHRDFQYNIVVCGEKAAALLAPEAQCEDLVVTIENQSTFSTAYEWCFDWPDCDPAMTSMTDELVFDWTFPDTGTYTIQLIAEPNSICADTFYHEIFLQYNSLAASYNVDVFECDNIASLELMDESIDTVSPPVGWFWEVSYGDPLETVTSTEQNPNFLVPLGIDNGVINFTVTSENGCIQSLTQMFETDTINPGDAILPDIEACIGDSPSLNPNSPSYFGYDYIWAPAGLLDDATSSNPTVLNVTGDQVFSVTITPGSNACEIIREVQLTAVELPVLDFSTFLECDGRTITFTNLSQNVASGAYVWDFGDPSSGDNISTEDNPVHTYSDIGTYTVTLAVADTELCTDTITMDITIPETELTADFGVKYLSETCSEDSVVVSFEDLSINTTLSPISTWEWEITPPGGVAMTGPNPTYTFFGSQTVDVTLTVTTDDGCVSSSTQQNIEITIVENEDQFPDTLIVCNGGSAQILPGGNPDYLYEWSPEDGIDDPTSPSPTFFPDVTTTYTVLVSNIGVDTCDFVEEVVVFVTPALNLEVDGDGVLCTDQAMLTATTDVDADITWLDDMGNTLATGNTYDFTITGVHNITVRAVDQYDCFEEENIVVRFDPVDVSIPDTVAVCLGDELDVSITNLDLNNTLTYTWTPVDAFVPGTETSSSPDVIETIGNQTLYVTVENQFGCIYQDSVFTTVYDDNINLSFTYEVQCDGSTVEFTNTSTDAFNYVWDFGDGSPLNYEESPTYNYGMAGEFEVTLSVVPLADCVVPVMDTVITVNPEVTAAFDYDIVECSPDSAVVAFFDLSESVFEIENWQWEPFGSIEQNPVTVFYNDGAVDVTLTITTSNGCMASVTETIDIQLVDLALADTIVMCKGDTTELNPGGALDQTYSWTPVETLDDPTSANPMAFPTETTVYTVEVYKEGSDTCFYTDQVTVFVPADINVDLGDDIITCGENVTLTAMADVDIDVEWFSVIDGPIGEDLSVTVNPFTTDTIIVVATDQYGCIDSDTIVVTDNGVDVADIPSEITACSGVDTTITITNLDPDDVLTYQWTPLENIIGPANEATVTVNVPEGCVIFTCLITNQNDCEETVMTEICVVPFDYEIPDTVFVCPNTPTGLNPDGEPSYSYMWSPADNLSETDIANPIFTNNVPGTYNYTATIFDNSQAITCETTEDVVVVVYPLLELATDGDTTMCEISTIPITATTAIDANIVWYDGLDEIGTGSPIDVTPEEGTNTYTAIATDPITGCTDTSDVVVQVNVLEIGIPDSIVYVCIDVPTEINPDGDSGLTYEWVPDTGLDLTTPWNPVATTSDTLFITVTITDPVGGCFLIREVTVIPYPAIIPVAQPDTAFICELASATLTVTSTVAADYTWFSDSGMNNVVGTGDTVVVNPANPQYYYVMAVDEFGCSEKDSAFVTRYPSLNLEAFGDTTLCEISTVPLWATSDVEVTFDWYEQGSDTPFASGDTVNVTPVEGTNNYIVIAEDIITGCLDTAMATVQVNVLEEGIPDSIVYVCSGVPTHINPAGYEGVLYEWIPNANIEYDPPWDPIVTTTDTITYFVTIEDPVGMCYLETTVTVIPYPLIIPVASPDTSFVCELDEAQLTVTTESGIEADFVWYDGPGLTPLDSIGIGDTIIVDPDSSQYFWVTATDEFGCVEIDSVYVLRYPSINLVADGDSTLCIANPVPLWATADVGVIIEWYEEGSDIPFATGTPVMATTMDGTNIYTAIATDTITGCMDTSMVTVQVNPIEIGVPDPVIYVCPNVDVNFFNGNPDLIYTWDCDDVIDDSDPYNPVVNTNDTITCLVTVEDPAGLCYLEAPVMIIAYPEINPAITPPEVALCEFESVELMGSADVSPADYVWFNDSAMDSVISMNPNVVVSPDSTQYYYLMVTDEFGCSEKDSVLVIRNPSLNLETDGDTTLCEIVPVILTAETSLTTTIIEWFEGAPLPDTPFDFESPIEVLPMEGTNTYTAIATDTFTGCMDTSVVIVQVNTLDVGIPDSIIYVCPNVDVAFFSGDPGLEYTWDCDDVILGTPANPIVNTNDTINCVVTIVDPVGMCYLEVPVTIIAHPEINPVIAQDTIVCNFNPLELFVSSDVADPTYDWFDIDNTPIGDGESVVVTPAGTEIYYVIATDEFGCSEVDSVQVDAYPIQAELLPQELIICETVETETLTAVNYGPEEIVSYNWSPSGLVEVTDVDSIAIGTLTGTFNPFCVELTNEYGCVETECTSITMISLIDSLSIEAVPDTILLDDSSVITVGGCTDCEFEWEWPAGSDLEPEFGPEVTATPVDTGTNIYTAFASLLGCEEVVETEVYVIAKICDENFVFLPTAFTPNNDGVNDILELRCFFKDEIEIEIMIYNRWGEEIVRSQDPYFTWDGTHNGEELPPDVFGYYLRVNCPGGEELVQKGSITLLK